MATWKHGGFRSPAGPIVATLLGFLLAPALATANPPEAGLADGAEQLRVGHYQQAVSTLASTIEQLQGEPGARTDLAQAHVLLAMAYFQLGQRPAAETAIRTALSLMPDLRIAPPPASAAFQRFLDAVRTGSGTGEALAAAEPFTPTMDLPRTADGPPPRGPARVKKGGGGGVIPFLSLVLGGAAGTGLGVKLGDEGPPTYPPTVQPPAEDPTLDKDGDGFSPANGDCDDDNALVAPGGPIIVSPAYATAAGIRINCTDNNYVSIVVSNRSCKVLKIQSINMRTVQWGGYAKTTDLTLSSTVSNIPPGGSAAVLDQRAVCPGGGCGCCTYGCYGAIYRLRHEFTVKTDAGEFRAGGYFWWMLFRNCQRCNVQSGPSVVEAAEAPEGLCSSATLDASGGR